MKIMPKIIIGFLFVVAVSAISGIFTMNLVQEMNSDISTVDRVKYPLNQYATNYQRGATQLWLGTYIYANGDDALGKQYIRNGKNMMQENREFLSTMVDESTSAELLSKENAAIEASAKVVSALEGESELTEDQKRFELNFLQQRVASR